MVSLMHPLFLRERKIRGCNEEEDVVRNILMEIRGYMRGCERVCEKMCEMVCHSSIFTKVSLPSAVTGRMAARLSMRNSNGAVSVTGLAATLGTPSSPILSNIRLSMGLALKA